MCPITEHEFFHYIVKVAVADHYDNVMTKLIVNNTDVLQTDINLFLWQQIVKFPALARWRVLWISYVCPHIDNKN